MTAEGERFSSDSDSVLPSVQDTERDKKHQRLLYQKETADNLSEAEGLVKNLFMDVDKAKKLQHPQALEIEQE